MLRSTLVTLIALISITVFSQNCGSISAWSHTGIVSGANTTYTINFDAISTSGGDKGVKDIIVLCGAVPINTNSACYISAPAGGTANSYSYSFTTLTCVSTLNLNYTGKTNNACGGSTCFSGSAGTPVPVTWLETSAKCIGNNTIISWSTASELNNQSFTIEKEVEGNWISMDWVKGQGTSSSISKYERILQDQGGIFRIKQIDYDGTISYSKIIKSKCVPKEPDVIPNPASSFLQFSTEVDQITLSTTLGTTVLVENNPTANLTIPDDIVSGLYVLRYMFEDQQYIKKIIIE